MGRKKSFAASSSFLPGLGKDQEVKNSQRNFHQEASVYQPEACRAKR